MLKVPVIKKNQNSAPRAARARAPEVADFWGTELVKIYLIDRKVYVFKNRKKCQITPL